MFTVQQSDLYSRMTIAHASSYSNFEQNCAVMMYITPKYLVIHLGNTVLFYP